MAIVKVGECGVGARENGQVVLRLPWPVRGRQVIFEAEAAQQAGTALANAGFDGIVKNPGYEVISNIRLRPYDEAGDALLELTFGDFGGPIVFALGPKMLAALAEAAQAALEFSRPAGEA